MTGEEAREVFVRTLEELQDEGLYLGPIPSLEPRKRAKRAPSRPRKKSRRPPACVSSRPSDGLEHEMSRECDPFWRASEMAWKRLAQLQQQDLAQAMHWLRQSQPVAFRQLSDDWLERISRLWASRQLTAFEEALEIWIGLHTEVVKTYQLVRTLQKP